MPSSVPPTKDMMSVARLRGNMEGRRGKRKKKDETGDTTDEVLRDMERELQGVG